MKRIVIIEGNALSLHRFGETYEVRIDNDRAEVALPLTPEAAEQIGASFREPIRVVVEIGDGEIAVGSLAGTTREELVHALAAARHAADEYQRENEALVKSNEGLRYDFDAMAAKNDELLEKIAAEAIPEGGLTREQLCRELDTRAIIARINDCKETP